MRKVIYWGNYDEAYSFFLSHIQHLYTESLLYVNDVFLYEKYSNVGLNVVLSTLIPERLMGIGGIVISTSGEGNAQIIKKLAHSLSCLSSQGELWIITSKNTGESFVKKVLAYLDLEAIVSYKEKKTKILYVKKKDGLEFSLKQLYDDFEITEDFLIAETIGGFDFYFSSTPSMFSKKRIDRGSLFLLNTINIKPEDTVLDYGCGYGIIGIGVARLFRPQKVYCVDIKTAAYDKTKENIIRNDVTDICEVSLLTSLKQYYNKVSVIVSHFPIHVSNEEKVTMMRECWKALTHKGRLICVIPITFDFENIVRKVFTNYRVIASDYNGYYIFEAVK